jgi:hypothetical protein
MEAKMYWKNSSFLGLNLIIPRRLHAAILSVFLIVGSTIWVKATGIDIYVASYGSGEVYRVPDTFGGGTVGLSQLFASGFSSPYALAIKDYQVYVGQLFNGQIYRNSTANLFATSPNQIFDMDFADSGNLHVVGSTSLAHVFNSNGVFQGSYSTGNSNGHGIDYDPVDGVHVAHPNSISHLTGSGTSYVDGTPPLLAAAFFNSSLQNIVKGPDGSLYASSYNADNTIYKVNPVTGVAIDLFPTSSVTIGGTNFNIQPIGVGIGPDNNLYFTDWFNFYLFRTDLNGGNPEIVAKGFVNPVGIDFVPEPSAALLLVVSGLLIWRQKMATE